MKWRFWMILIRMPMHWCKSQIHNTVAAMVEPHRPAMFATRSWRTVPQTRNKKADSRLDHVQEIYRERESRTKNIVLMQSSIWNFAF
jgi:hypothetical protein